MHARPRATSPAPSQDYSKAIELDPNTLRPTTTGASHTRTGRPGGAIRTTARPSSSTPSTPRPTTTGVAHYDLGDLAAHPTTTRPSSSTPIRRGLQQPGHRYYDKGDLDGAIQDYDKAIELDPNTPRLQQPGQRLLRPGRPGRAIAGLQQGHRARPQYAAAYSNRGSLTQDQGDPDGHRDYDKAIELDPKRHGLQQPGIARRPR